MIIQQTEGSGRCILEGGTVQWMGFIINCFMIVDSADVIIKQFDRYFYRQPGGFFRNRCQDELQVLLCVESDLASLDAIGDKGKPVSSRKCD